MINKK